MARYYYLPSVGLCCLWSPKVGCTTLSEWLVKDILGHTGCEWPVKIVKDSHGNTLAHWPRKYLQSHGFRYDLSQIQRLHSDGSIEKFVITTRNPYDRIVSCFTNLFINWRGQPILKPDDLGPNGRTILRRWSLGFDWRGRFVGFSFRQLLDKTLQSLADGKSVNDHVGPQIESDEELEFIRSLGSAATFVDVRQFSESLPEVTRQLGIKHHVPIPHLNNSTAGGGWIRDESPGNERVRSRDFALQRRIPTRDSLFTDSMSARFRAAFNRDFVLFSFCSTSQGSLKRCA